MKAKIVGTSRKTPLEEALPTGVHLMSLSFILTTAWNTQVRARALAAILDHEVPLRMEATAKDGRAD